MDQKKRRLVAIMFTDIVGYTAMMQENEELASEVRAHHRQEFQRCHEVHHGEILQYFGDGTLSVFQSGVEAIECAIALQKALKIGQPVPLRIGLHVGDVVFDGTEIYGDGVNLASRIENLSVAGAILLSGRLNDEVKNQTQVSTKSLGKFELKNIVDPVEVFAVTNQGIKVPDPSEIKGRKSLKAKTISVLPFVNMSSSEDNEYFSDGITEEIINALAKIKGLKVTSRTSSFFFKNKNIPVAQIGQELNVSTILEGSVRLSGNKMRITAQLIDVTDDFHFWSETFDRTLDDIFAVQDEVSLLIADKLREHIGHFDIEDHLVEAQDIPIEVYQTYLKGRYHLMKLNLPSTEKAISIFKEVIAAQPDFPLSYLGINQGYAFLGTMGQIPAFEAFTKAKPFLDKALELDKDLPESQLNLSWIACWQNWDLKSAYQHLNNALEVRPSDEHYLTMANLLTVEGKFEEAHVYIEKALQLAPLAAMNIHYKGFLFYMQEKYTQAISFCKASLQLKADLPFPQLSWGLSLLLSGDKAEGLSHFLNLPDGVPGDLTKLGGTTLAYALLKDEEKMEAGIAQLEAALETGAMGSALNFLIQCHTLNGQTDKALQLIEQGISIRIPLMLLLKSEPILKPLRSLPRFQTLMRDIMGDPIEVVQPKRKYKKSLFDKELLAQYQEQLESVMSDKEPYLDPGLTIRSLAEIMGIPPNHLSQLLNEGFDKNFAEYINSYRLEAFKIKAADPSQQHLTILALAFDSGFNSKTVFNTFFKKAMGITPKAYWKEIARQ